MIIKTTALTAALCLGFAGATDAAEIFVSSNISTTTFWTSDNTYNLVGQIFVLPGATLTIQPGTVIASTTGAGGSLAVSRGAQINALGTADEPIIFTSTSDVATWKSGVDGVQDTSRVGEWREAANEWGNLTIMGRGYISEDDPNLMPLNSPVPAGTNRAFMEGLTPDSPSDTKTLYGGGNDNDDSGSISYLSLRYGGRVVALTNELNGLSLGGIGRGTDISHIDIMNNVDDGIEIWGGTVNIKYANIWNIGDDSFDIDQGWRGKAQFVCIVQGWSVDANQGSGVGDNCIEVDGAENSDWQPVTTSTIYNATVIGQPLAGDHGVAYRDGARLQVRNSIFMDLGEELVKFDNIDGDGGLGYGNNGTLSWPAVWSTSYTATSTVNAPANPAAFYTVQTSGTLSELSDSVFFRNFDGGSLGAYDEATARGVLAPSQNNTVVPGFFNYQAPVRNLQRGDVVVKGGRALIQVVGLDPRPANEALTSVAAAPDDGFFTPAQYRGAFAPERKPWISGWTAAAAFGFLDPVLDPGQRGSQGAPTGGPTSPFGGAGASL